MTSGFWTVRFTCSTSTNVWWVGHFKKRCVFGVFNPRVDLVLRWGKRICTFVGAHLDLGRVQSGGSDPSSNQIELLLHIFSTKFVLIHSEPFLTERTSIYVRLYMDNSKPRWLRILTHTWKQNPFSVLDGIRNFHSFGTFYLHVTDYPKIFLLLNDERINLGVITIMELITPSGDWTGRW